MSKDDKYLQKDIPTSIFTKSVTAGVDVVKDVFAIFIILAHIILVCILFVPPSLLLFTILIIVFYTCISNTN